MVFINFIISSMISKVVLKLPEFSLNWWNNTVQIRNVNRKREQVSSSINKTFINVIPKPTK